MPPWPPEPGHGDFAGERRLSDEQIALIQRWVGGGRAEGDRRRPPPAAAVPRGLAARARRTWCSSRRRPYTRPRRRHGRLPQLRRPVAARRGPRYVRALELRPGDKHGRPPRQRPPRPHAAPRGGSTPRDPGPGFARHGRRAGVRGLRARTATSSSGSRARPPYEEPAGHGLAPRRRDRPRAQPAPSALGQAGACPARGRPLLHRARRPRRYPMLLQLEHDGAIDIPPGPRTSRSPTSYALPVDVDVLGVYPHAHYLGKDVAGPGDPARRHEEVARSGSRTGT